MNIPGCLKRLLFFLAAACMPLAQATGRKNAVDSLKVALQEAQSDTMRLSILGKIAKQLPCEDSAEKWKFIGSYAQLAAATGSREHMLHAHYLTGRFYFDCAGKYTLAEHELGYCAETATEYGFNDLGISAYIDLAELNVANTHMEKAVECCQKALQLNPGNDACQAIWGNMGILFKSMGNYTGALGYFEKVYTAQSKEMALAKTNSRNDSLSLMLLIVNIAQLNACLGANAEAIGRYRLVQALNSAIRFDLMDVYCYDGIANCLAVEMPDSAIDYYNKALLCCRNAVDPSQQMNILNELGEMYLQKGDPARAARYAALALALDKTGVTRNGHTDHSYLPATYVLLGKISVGKKDFAGAVRNLSQAIARYREAADTKEESDTWQLLSHVYENMAKPQNALVAYKNYVRLRDSIFSQEKASELTRIEMNAEFDRAKIADSMVQAHKDATAKAALNKQRRDKKFFAAGGVLMLVIAGVSVWFLLYTRKSKRQIEMLMREMHHRVKNNLQIVTTLLNLQLADVPDEKAKKTIEEGITRISSIALIHHHLYRIDDMASLEISSFIKELLSQVAAIYTQHGQQLTTNFHMPPTHLDVDTAIPLGLALNELMTNSFKYAYTGKTEYIMDINLTGRGDTYTISYCDHGPGLPQNFDIETSESLGMRIIQSLASQLGGSFTFRYADNCFVFTFKDTRHRRHTA